MENIDEIPSDLPEELNVVQVYNLKVKVALGIMVLLSLTIARYGFWFLGEAPKYEWMQWYMVVSGALAYMFFPLLYLGIAYLSAYLRKKPSPRVLEKMIIIWATFLFFSYIGNQHH